MCPGDVKGQNTCQTFIITEVHIWQAFKRVKIKKSFVTRCTLIWPEFFLKVSCVFIFLLHDLIENPSKISEILLCNLKKGLKGQNSGQTFIITEAHIWQAFYLEYRRLTEVWVGVTDAVWWKTISFNNWLWPNDKRYHLKTCPYQNLAIVLHMVIFSDFYVGHKYF